MISFIALSGLFRFYFFFSIPFFTPFLFIAVVLMQANMLSSRNGELTQKPNKQKEPKKSLWLIYLPFSICQSTKSDFVHASTKSIYIHKHTHTHTPCVREKNARFLENAICIKYTRRWIWRINTKSKTNYRNDMLLVLFLLFLFWPFFVVNFFHWWVRARAVCL